MRTILQNSLLTLSGAEEFTEVFSLLNEKEQNYLWKVVSMWPHACNIYRENLIDEFYDQELNISDEAESLLLTYLCAGDDDSAIHLCLFLLRSCCFNADMHTRLVALLFSRKIIDSDEAFDLLNFPRGSYAGLSIAVRPVYDAWWLLMQDKASDVEINDSDALIKALHNVSLGAR